MEVDYVIKPCPFCGSTEILIDKCTTRARCKNCFAICELPSVNPAPKMGHWSHDGSHWENRWICSECGYKLFDEQTRFCPNCGAKMEG